MLAVVVYFRKLLSHSCAFHFALIFDGAAIHIAVSHQPELSPPLAPDQRDELVLPLVPRPAIFDMFPVAIVVFDLNPNPFFTKATNENMSPTKLMLLINKPSNIAREYDGTEGIGALRVKALLNGLGKDMR
jgi:hypothetical protein